MNRAQGPQRREPGLPPLGVQEAFSGEGIAKDDLKGEQGLARKGGRAGEAHTWSWLAAVQGNPRGTACETGKRTRGTADQMLESRLRQVLSRSASFCRPKDRIQDPERASEQPGGLGKTRRCRGLRTGTSSKCLLAWVPPCENECPRK